MEEGNEKARRGGEERGVSEVSWIHTLLLVLTCWTTRSVLQSSVQLHVRTDVLVREAE